jgi:hypothetical protein
MVFHKVPKALAGRNLQGLLCFMVCHVVSFNPTLLAALLSASQFYKIEIQPNGKKVNRYKG